MSHSTVPGVALSLLCYNEEENLRHVVDEAIFELSQLHLPFVINVIDDGSTDNTAEAARLLQGKHPEIVKLYQHDRNRGYGDAVRTALEKGLTTNFEWVGYVDGDRQFQLSEISMLIDAASSAGATMAIGRRLHRADSLKRKLMGKGWHFVSHLMLGYKAKDTDCGFKMIRRDSVELISPRLVGHFAAVSAELLMWSRKLGLDFVEVDVTHVPRIAGEQTGGGLTVALKSFYHLFRVWMHVNFPQSARFIAVSKHKLLPSMDRSSLQGSSMAPHID